MCSSRYAGESTREEYHGRRPHSPILRTYYYSSIRSITLHPFSLCIIASTENILYTTNKMQDTVQRQLQPIWHPTTPADKIPMNTYRAHINHKFAQNLTTSQDLHRWSVTNPQDFWLDLHDYTGIIPKLPASVTQAYDASLPMSKVPKFFEGAVVNYAENVLSGKPLDKLALVGIREMEAIEGDKWTWGDVTEMVRRVQGALKASGVQKGDRVGAIISTSVWSVVLFLATASIGAVWSSIAPDIGEEVSHISGVS